MVNKVFVIDADALIHAYRYDFPPDGDHSGFWDWLNSLGEKMDIIIPEKVLKEIRGRNDGLADLIMSLGNLKHEPTINSVKYLPVVLGKYGELTEIDMEVIGGKADPYLIAHAISLEATVVTNEIPEPRRTVPINKKIPDICNSLEVPYKRYPHFIWEMRGVSA